MFYSSKTRVITAITIIAWHRRYGVWVFDTIDCIADSYFKSIVFMWVSSWIRAYGTIGDLCTAGISISFRATQCAIIAHSGDRATTLIGSDFGFFIHCKDASMSYVSVSIDVAVIIRSAWGFITIVIGFIIPVIIPIIIIFTILIILVVVVVIVVSSFCVVSTLTIIRIIGIGIMY